MILEEYEFTRDRIITIVFTEAIGISPEVDLFQVVTYATFPGRPNEFF